MMLKKMMVVVVAALVVSAGTRVSGAEVSAEVGADYMSMYVWRGMLLEHKPVLQPWVGVSIDKLSIEAWGNMTTRGKDGGEFNEIDLTIDYSDALTETIGYSVGLIYYTFPNSDDNSTTEIYGGLSFDAPLSPSLTLYYDVDEVEGVYLSFGIGQDIELTESLTLETGASIGWGNKKYNEAYWGEDSSKMQDISFSVGMPIELGSWTLSPSVSYVNVMSGTLRASGGTKSDMIIAGIGLSTSF